MPRPSKVGAKPKGSRQNKQTKQPNETKTETPEKEELSPKVSTDKFMTTGKRQTRSQTKQESAGGKEESAGGKEESEFEKKKAKKEAENKSVEELTADSETPQQEAELMKPKTPEKNTEEEGNEEAKGDHNTILETGHICFLYRPKVEHNNAEGIDDIQGLFILLHTAKLAGGIEAESEELKHQGEKLRLLKVGKKKLPLSSEHQRMWSIIVKVTNSFEEMAKVLNKREYSTTTRGERHESTMRLVAEGVYVVVMHHNTAHLAYALELPEKKLTPEPGAVLGEVQDELQIEPEQSLVLMVKNPDIGTSGRKPEYPDELMSEFAGRRWITPQNLKLLDYSNAEVLLIGASGNLEEELGAEGIGLEIAAGKSPTAVKEFLDEIILTRNKEIFRPISEGKWS